MPPLPAQPAYTPLPEATQYELHLGPNAFIDVQQAFINALLLDPSGTVVRVLAEELAAKGVPCCSSMSRVPTARFWVSSHLDGASVAQHRCRRHHRSAGHPTRPRLER